MAGTFKWADSSAYDFEYWFDGEPNSNGQDGANCVEVYSPQNARWNDESCTGTYNEFICMTDKCIFCSMKKLKFTLLFVSVPKTTNNPSTTPATTHQDSSPATTKSTESTPRTTKTTSRTDPWTTDPWDTPTTTKSTPTQPNGETTVALPSKRE